MHTGKRTMTVNDPTSTSSSDGPGVLAPGTCAPPQHQVNTWVDIWTQGLSTTSTLIASSIKPASRRLSSLPPSGTAPWLQSSAPVSRMPCYLKHPGSWASTLLLLVARGHQTSRQYLANRRNTWILQPDTVVWNKQTTKPKLRPHEQKYSNPWQVLPPIAPLLNSSENLNDPKIFQVHNQRTTN